MTINNKMLTTAPEISAWLLEHNIKEFELSLHPLYNYAVDTSTDINLSNKNLDFVPVKFNSVRGNFNCSHNFLTDLSFAPESVSEDFNCSHNFLTSLEGSPLRVGQSFYCYHNYLTTLKNFNTQIGHNFNCSHNRITDLIIDLNFEGKAYISHNPGFTQYPSILNKSYREKIILKNVLQESVTPNQIQDINGIFKL